MEIKTEVKMWGIHTMDDGLFLKRKSYSIKLGRNRKLRKHRKDKGCF